MQALKRSTDVIRTSGPTAEGSDSPRSPGALDPTQDDSAERLFPAFDALYDRTVARIYAYLRMRTTGDEEAADLAQQIYLKALNAWERRPHDENLLVPWLFHIARNAATDVYRRRRPVVAWESLPEPLQPASDQRLEEQMLRRESAARLSALVEQLPAPKRELLALRFAADLTYAEIGATVGKSEDAVKQQILRLLYSLRDHYDER